VMMVVGPDLEAVSESAVVRWSLEVSWVVALVMSRMAPRIPGKDHPDNLVGPDQAECYSS
jgi:hypothetical protein